MPCPCTTVCRHIRNSDFEFLRVLRQYHPRYLVRMYPDFYEDVFLKQITDRLLKTGVLSEVHRAGAMRVYEVRGDPAI